jgi:alpha-beta hydrolase superfamily lysophospholipase
VTGTQAEMKLVAGWKRELDNASSFYFQSSGQTLFGWLHTPPAEVDSSPWGLLLCYPFGYEAICSHRALRTIAEAAAGQGVATLRFDYVGAGDSADVEPEQDLIKSWIVNIRSAVAQLRERTGVSRVCILGVRIGALLANLAAAELPEVQAFASLAPMLSGKRYIRDLRITVLAEKLRIRPEELSEGTLAAAGDGAIEISGFVLNRASLDTLATLEIGASTTDAFSHVLILDSRSAPATEQWATKLRAAGCVVRQAFVPGIAGIPITAPQFGVVPEILLEHVAAWLAELPRRPDPLVPRLVAAPSLSTLKVEPTGGAAGTPLHGPVCEISARIEAAVPLFGILTQPGVADRRRRRGVIFINAAADYHVGSGRMYVSLARRWAACGYYVLRFDLAGLGDSATRAGCFTETVFPSAALDDVAAVIRFLKDDYGICDVTLVGLCSGGYHGLRAAVARLPVARIMMINPLNYFWNEGAKLQDLHLAEVMGKPPIYRKRVFVWRAWKNLLLGRHNVWRIAQVHLRRVLLTLEAPLRGLARRLRIRLRQDLGAELEELAARGVRTVFVFARGEPGLSLLYLQAGPSVARLGDACRIRVIDGADHSFGRKAERTIMEDALSHELFAPSAAHRAGG